MPDPTQPAPMSEEQFKAIEWRLKSRCIPPDPSERDDLVAAVAEVRRLNAEKKAAWKAAGDEMVWRMAVENDRDAKAKELTAVRAERDRLQATEYHIHPLSALMARADRAEAAARELYDVLDIVGGNSLIKYQPMIRATLAKAAKALGLTITEEGKENGGTESVRDVR